MKNHKRLLLFQWKYTKTPMSKFECFGHAVKGQSYYQVIIGFTNDVWLVGAHDAQESVGCLTCVSSYVQCYFGEYFKVNRLFQGLCSANSMKLIFTTNWSIYLSIVIHFIFKSSNAILMVGFVLTNFLMQMLKYLIHAKYMQKIHHLQDQWKKRQILTWR